MPEYTYTFYDLRTQTKLGALPLYGVSASDVLLTGKGGASAGAFTGSVRMDSDFVDSPQEILDMTRPEATAVWMDRNGSPIWGGILWTRTYQSDGRVLQLNAQTFSSYLSKVVYYPDSSSPLAIPQYDLTDNPFNVIRFLYGYLRDHASAEYDLGIEIADYFQLGDPVLNPEMYTTVSFLLSDRKFLNEYASAMLALGCEYRIRPYLNEAGERKCIVEVGFAKSLGVTPEAADYGESFEYPGELAKYWLTNSAANAPTRLFGVGKVSGAEDIFTLQQGSVTNRIGIDEVQTYETDNQSKLEIMAAGDLVKLQGDLHRPVYDVAGSEDGVDMGWSLGDARRIVIDDPYRYALPMSGVVRLTGWQLAPADSSNVEALSITIDDPELMEPLNV